MCIRDREEGDIAGPFDLGAVVTKTIDEDTEAKLIVFSSETLLDEQVDSMVSVSYTHLDVYKRQLYRSGRVRKPSGYHVQRTVPYRM